MTTAIGTNGQAHGNFTVRRDQKKEIFDTPKPVPNKVFNSVIAYFNGFDKNSEDKQSFYARMCQRPKTIVNGKRLTIIEDNTNEWRIDIQNPTKKGVNLQVQTGSVTIATILVDSELCGYGGNTDSDRAQRAAVSKYVARQFGVLLRAAHDRRLAFKAHVSHR